MPTSKNIEEIKALAMSDELFEPEVIDLEDCCGCQCHFESGTDACCSDCFTVNRITVIQKEKHFRNRRYIVLPSWNEDVDSENECLLL